jgi:ATP-dependent RNA helicase RhlE
VIHSNKGQNSRINAVNEFKQGKLRVLVSTDVTSRGIDVAGVSHVVNFDVPVVYEDYVHRIGRTGRAFHDGKAITFSTPAEEYHIGKIEELIRERIPLKKLPDEIEIAETPSEERKEMARALDRQRRKENPEYKGAFHERKSAGRRSKN